MWKFYALLVVGWLSLIPPLFTDGDCTAELKAESDRINADAETLTFPDRAVEYWRKRSVPLIRISRDQCLRVKPRFLSDCGAGPLVYAKVPVRNKVCRLYRDDEIKVQLQFDNRDYLTRVAIDMNPYRSLPIPFTGKTIHWGR